MKLLLVGFGQVGRAFTALLAQKSLALRERYGLPVTVIGIATSRGLLCAPRGLDLLQLLETGLDGYRLLHGTSWGPWQPEMLAALPTEVVVEVTPTNLVTGEPGLQHIRAALQAGRQVITSNAGPLALAGMELLSLAERHGVELRAEATVLSGTPVFSLIHDGLAGARIWKLRGILSATTNFLLAQLERGHSLETALAEARLRGYTDADPTANLDGTDAAAQLSILAALVFQRALTPAEVRREGRESLCQEEIRAALARDQHYKLVASLEQQAWGELVASVGLDLLDQGDPLAPMQGATCALTIETSALTLTISGPGAGPQAAAQGLLNDLVALGRGVHRHAREAALYVG